MSQSYMAETFHEQANYFTVVNSNLYALNVSCKHWLFITTLANLAS